MSNLVHKNVLHCKRSSYCNQTFLTLMSIRSWFFLRGKIARYSRVLTVTELVTVSLFTGPSLQHLRISEANKKEDLVKSFLAYPIVVHCVWSPFWHIRTFKIDQFFDKVITKFFSEDRKWIHFIRWNTKRIINQYYFRNIRRKSSCVKPQEACRSRRKLCRRGGGGGTLYPVQRSNPSYKPDWRYLPEYRPHWGGGGGIPAPGKGPGSRDHRSGGIPPLWTDTQLWKHYLPIVLRKQNEMDQEQLTWLTSLYFQFTDQRGFRSSAFFTVLN